MRKNLLNNFVFKLLESIEKNLSIYIINKKPEYLHNLRVDFKKIKAVLSFAENVYKEEYDIDKLKLIFSKAGKIREIQINIHVLELFPYPPKNLIKQLKKKEDELTMQFLKCGARYVKLIKNFSENIYLPKKLPTKTLIKNFFKREKLKANKKLKKQERLELHKYRTKIKKLMYVYNILPKRIQKDIEFNEVEIDRRQDKLGNWHDTYSAINFLSHEHFPKKTSQYVAKLKEKENKQFNSLLKSFTIDSI